MGLSMLVYGDSTVLPASFRYPSSRRLRHGRLIDVTGEFARVPARMRPRRRLRGTFYHLDPSNPGHFGHVLTESVSRLWGWDEAKAAFPDLKVLFRLRRADQPTTLERTLYTAYGVAPDDIVWADEPVWLSSLVTATPMWQNEDPHYVHPGIEQVWRRLRSLAGPTAGRPRRIFVSRRPTLLNRPWSHTAAVEAVFARHGFTIVHPEDLDFAEQATVFAAAEVVAGFGGSALYNVMYSEGFLADLDRAQPRGVHRSLRIPVLDGARVHPALLLEHARYPSPRRCLERSCVRLAWEFDFDRNGAELADVLSSLG